MRDLDQITVSRRDLELVDEKVVFENIGEFISAEDITEEVFGRKVYRIVYVGEVVIPKTLPTLTVASRCVNVGKILVKE